MAMVGLSALRERARALKRQTLTVYFVARDPRLPWGVRVLALAIAAYALSPIDLIPDFIPVLGLLDDVILVPLGVALVLRLAPPALVDNARREAAVAAERPVSRWAAAVIVLLWLAVAGLAVVLWRR
ncbi:MAG: hypothetical protein AVDCRST_MAG71-2394 [uncultured Lysobacter sp.]|uniref:DUF1232 domain-containing protein n=1 Tax=uncultured Lysobacter sp. TaxID=271060 RepID=A0A6J4LZA8_9GAMM|nr:MAG: hypothetical protein AVDCRST_MAG71-2394 [uncultured Lysobacter sp.]